MQKTIISGIQQMGIGVYNLAEAWNWYISHFGMDVKVFEDKNTAALMLPHTGGKPREKHAALAINMQGGGGFEIWQHTGKTPDRPLFKLELGDLGICVTKLKCVDINAAMTYQKTVSTDIVSHIETMPSGQKHFFVKDLYENIFQFVEEPNIFQDVKRVPSGGVYGAIIGVQDINKSLPVYTDILGYDQIIYDETGQFTDLNGVQGGNGTFHRVLLQHSKKREGAFSPLLGTSQIELIQCIDRTPLDIYEGRIWGDPGFIHLCFDINGMAALREFCSKKGYPFTVDSSNNFEMGDAAGHFSYIQAPEGTLIEFVETYRIPVLKKIGWYIDLRKRNQSKTLPRFLLKALALNRVKQL